VGFCARWRPPAEEPIPPFLARLFHRVPLLRAPPPHARALPIVFFSAAAAFDLLFLGTGQCLF